MAEDTVTATSSSDNDTTEQDAPTLATLPQEICQSIASFLHPATASKLPLLSSAFRNHWAFCHDPAFAHRTLRLLSGSNGSSSAAHTRLVLAASVAASAASLLHNSVWTSPTPPTSTLRPLPLLPHRLLVAPDTPTHPCYLAAAMRAQASAFWAAEYQAMVVAGVGAGGARRRRCMQPVGCRPEECARAPRVPGGVEEEELEVGWRWAAGGGGGRAGRYVPGALCGPHKRRMRAACEMLLTLETDDPVVGAALASDVGLVLFAAVDMLDRVPGLVGRVDLFYGRGGVVVETGVTEVPFEPLGGLLAAQVPGAFAGVDAVEEEEDNVDAEPDPTTIPPTDAVLEQAMLVAALSRSPRALEVLWDAGLVPSAAVDVDAVARAAAMAVVVEEEGNEEEEDVAGVARRKLEEMGPMRMGRAEPAALAVM
ncbi:hypothetical protein HDU96_008067 [Phlyctochytrium bullatum]|nr:hypothetical protein HDU96_008067 [Phlyctochytrium bullatum]